LLEGLPLSESVLGFAPGTGGVTLETRSLGTSEADGGFTTPGMPGRSAVPVSGDVA